MAKQKPGQESGVDRTLIMDEEDVFQNMYGTDGSQPDVPKFDLPKPPKPRHRGNRKAPAHPGGTRKGFSLLRILLILTAVVLAAVLVDTVARTLLQKTCAFGHIWAEATCTEPRTCRGCGETEGSALGHLPGNTSCTTPTVCLQCDIILEEPSGHTWRAASQDCIHCHIPFPESLEIPGDAMTLRQGDVTRFYKVFAVSANKWAPNHCKKTAQLYVVKNKVTWDIAVDICEETGGRMAEITTPEIQEHVYTELIASRYPEITVYFGLTDAEDEGQWQWLSGEEVSYTNWHSGQPDGKKYENHAGFYGEYGDGKWRDGNFTEDTRYFICEWVLSNH